MELNFKLNKISVILLVIAIFAFSIRLYFLLSTSSQVFWWDEAEYGLQAQNFAGLTEEGASILRPVLLPAMLSPLVAAGISDFGLRFVEILFAVAGVLLLYLLAKELTQKEYAALAAAFFLSIFWLHLFYTNRFLTEVPSLTFLIGGIFFFLISYKPQTKIYYPILAGLLFSAAFLTRFPIAIAILSVTLFIFAVKRLQVLRQKETWVTLGSFAVFSVPFFIWAQLKFGDALAPIRLGSEGAGGATLGLPSLLTYFKWLPHYFSIPLLILLAIAMLILFANLVLNHKTVMAEKREYLLLALLIFLPLLYFSMQPHAEDRYLMVIFPALFILMGLTVDKIYSALAGKSKYLALFVIGLLLISATALEFSRANSMIAGKADSYAEIRDAGAWLKENTAPADTIVSASGPQLSYYSGRKIISFGSGPEDFSAKLEEFSPRYVTISVFEPHPEWIKTFFNESQLTEVKSFGNDGNSAIVIYELNSA